MLLSTSKTLLGLSVPLLALSLIFFTKAQEPPQNQRENNAKTPNTLTPAPPQAGGNTKQGTQGYQVTGNDVLVIDSTLKNLQTEIRKLHSNEENMLGTLNVPFWKSPSFWVSVILSIGVSIWVTYIFAKKGSTELYNTSYDLNQQILNIREVTNQRYILRGFPEIFRKAEDMLNGSRDVFWMLGFTPFFGHIHEYNPSIRQAIEEDKRGNMKARTVIFRNGVATKAETCKDYKLAHLIDDEFRDYFVTPISQKPGSGLMNNESAKQTVIKMNTEAVEMIRRNLDNAGKDVDEHCRVVSNIPIQILIADSAKLEKKSITKHGITTESVRSKACLVFFVGTGNVGSEQPERGIYTEVPELVDLFQSVFRGIVDYARRHQNAGSN